jgi:hypothetical protein
VRWSRRMEVRSMIYIFQERNVKWGIDKINRNMRRECKGRRERNQR